MFIPRAVWRWWFTFSSPYSITLSFVSLTLSLCGELVRNPSLFVKGMACSYPVHCGGGGSLSHPPLPSLSPSSLTLSLYEELVRNPSLFVEGMACSSPVQCGGGVSLSSPSSITLPFVSLPAPLSLHGEPRAMWRWCFTFIPLFHHSPLRLSPCPSVSPRGTCSTSFFVRGMSKPFLPRAKKDYETVPHGETDRERETKERGKEEGD